MGDGKLTWAMCLLPGFNGWHIHQDGINDSHAGRCMNVIASRFLKTDCTDWLNIDTDIEFTAEHIKRIMSHDVPLVYGVYPKKNEDTEPCLSTFKEVTRHPNGLIEVARAARGFMRVRREVLEAMKEENGGPALRYHNHGEVQWEFFPSGVIPIHTQEKDEAGFPLREWLSEDWYFCDRARSLGYKILVDDRIVLGHEGMKMYRFKADQVRDERPFWKQIPGWFTEEDAKCYQYIAEHIPANARVAEVGVWMGRSLICFHAQCRAIGKSPSIIAVDTFRGTASEGEIHALTVREFGGDVREKFEENAGKAEINGQLFIMQRDSLDAASRVPYESLDAVFLDADHEYEAVKNDIRQWSQSVKQGGIIAGHDINRESVYRAVNESFQGEVMIIGNCWLAIKP